VGIIGRAVQSRRPEIRGMSTTRCGALIRELFAGRMVCHLRFRGAAPVGHCSPGGTAVAPRQCTHSLSGQLANARMHAHMQHYRGRVMQEAVPLGEGSMVALMPIDVPTANAIATK
jgi:hypothetical protein